MALVAPRPARGLTARGAGQRLGRTALELVVPAALLGAWWAVSAGSTALYFPPLSRILSTFQHVWVFAQFRSDALPSLLHLAEGLLLSTVLGVLGGVVLGLLPRLADAFAPVLEFLRAVPGVALVPAALLLFGIGPTMQVVVIVTSTVWPILLNTLDGVRGVDPLLLDVSRSYRLRQSDRLLRVVLRAASPQIVAGLRIALSVGIVVIVFSELVGATHGIGFQLLSAERNFAIPEMWASMVLLGLLGYLLNTAFRLLEAVVLGWHRAMRAGQGSNR